VTSYFTDFFTDKGIKQRLDRISYQLDQLNKTLLIAQGRDLHMSVEMDNLVASVENIKGVIPSGIATIQGLAAKVAALTDEIANLNPEQSAAIQALADELNAKAADMATAIAANPV
jgi:chromosome segregation ATPase